MRDGIFGFSTEEIPFNKNHYDIIPQEGLATTVERDILSVDQILTDSHIPDILFPVYSPGIQTDSQADALASLVDAWNFANPDKTKLGYMVYASTDVGMGPLDSYVDRIPTYLRKSPKSWVRGSIYPLKDANDNPVHDTFAEVRIFVQQLNQQSVEAQSVGKLPYEKGVVIAMAPHVLGINSMVQALGAESLVTVVSAEGVLRATDYNKFLKLINNPDYIKLTEHFYQGEVSKNLLRLYGGLNSMQALSLASSKLPSVKKVIHKHLHR